MGKADEFLNRVSRVSSDGPRALLEWWFREGGRLFFDVCRDVVGQEDQIEQIRAGMQGLDWSGVQKVIPVIPWIKFWIEVLLDAASDLSRLDETQRDQFLRGKEGFNQVRNVVEVFPEGFWEALKRKLASRGEEGESKPGVIFPVVVREDSHLEGEGVLLRLCLQRLENGRGDVFPDPAQVLVRPIRDRDFAEAFRRAADAVRRLIGSDRLPDVAVRIKTLNPEKEWLFRWGLEGPSAGGALALSLWSVWKGEPVDTTLVVSFALTGEGEAGPVGWTEDKARACALQGRTLVVHQGNSDVISEALQGFQLAPLIIPINSLEKAIEAARLFPAGFSRYLDELEKEAEANFPWDPAKRCRDVAVPVFVRYGRQWDKEDEWNEGFYKRHRRIVLVGPPGSGKSFTKAVTVLNLIDEARRCIREGRLEEVPIPVMLGGREVGSDQPMTDGRISRL